MTCFFEFGLDVSSEDASNRPFPSLERRRCGIRSSNEAKWGSNQINGIFRSESGGLMVGRVPGGV